MKGAELREISSRCLVLWVKGLVSVGFRQRSQRLRAQGFKIEGWAL